MCLKLSPIYETIYLKKTHNLETTQEKNQFLKQINETRNFWLPFCIRLFLIQQSQEDSFGVTEEEKNNTNHSFTHIEEAKKRLKNIIK